MKGRHGCFQRDRVPDARRTFMMGICHLPAPLLTRAAGCLQSGAATHALQPGGPNQAASLVSVSRFSRLSLFRCFTTARPTRDWRRWATAGRQLTQESMGSQRRMQQVSWGRKQVLAPAVCFHLLRAKCRDRRSIQILLRPVLHVGMPWGSIDRWIAHAYGPKVHYSQGSSFPLLPKPSPPPGNFACLGSSGRGEYCSGTYLCSWIALQLLGSNLEWGLGDLSKQEGGRCKRAVSPYCRRLRAMAKVAQRSLKVRGHGAGDMANMA